MRVHRTGSPFDDEMQLEMGLEAIELDFLRQVPDRLRDVLLHPEHAPKVIDRLFPVAHAKNPEEEAEHRRLLGETLVERRLAALTGYDATLARARIRSGSWEIVLTSAEVDLWLHVLNDLRLLLATELDIDDNDWRMRAARTSAEVDSFAILSALTYAQQVLLSALDVPPDGGAGEL